MITEKVKKIRRDKARGELLKTKKIEPEKFERATVERPIMRPGFHISLKHLPEAKNWEIGKTYKIILEIKQTSISVDIGRDKEERGDVGFDIMGIKVLSNKNG